MFLERAILGHLQVGATAGSRRSPQTPALRSALRQARSHNALSMYAYRTHAHCNTTPQGDKALQFQASRGAMQLQEEIARIG